MRYEIKKVGAREYRVTLDDHQGTITPPTFYLQAGTREDLYRMIRVIEEERAAARRARHAPLY